MSRIAKQVQSLMIALIKWVKRVRMMMMMMMIISPHSCLDLLDEGCLTSRLIRLELMSGYENNVCVYAK